MNVPFTTTPGTLTLISKLLLDTTVPLSLEAANTFVQMIQKRWKEPSNKLDLIRVLSNTIPGLEQRTRSDKEQVQFWEGLRKLTNVLGLKLCKLIEEVS